MTDQLYLRDAYLKTMDAVVQEIRDGAVVLDRSVFYATGGGQPHDTGTLTWTDASGDAQTCRVVEIKKQGADLLHKIDGDAPPVGMTVFGEIDWDRRYVLMRYHTALHSVSGVIYRLFGSLVTGGQMYTDRARMDFALEDLSAERRQAIVDETNRLLAEGHPIHVTVLPREEAFQIPDLIRTNINLLPPAIQDVRVVNIEGIDQQADGGTHVANTAEVGRVRISKFENKGRINKRLEIVLES
ncbi:MAG: alanyl-tRNA editing protein [Chloroflexi bacterium]|nr:alanyl-tRNA editing protein [Chloroflexota bacterium]